MKKKIGIIIAIFFIVAIICIVIMNVAKEYKLNSLSYNITIYEWENFNREVVGGYADVLESVLVNAEKKELYRVYYNDVWKEHEKQGDKDSIEIEIYKLSDSQLSELISKYNSEKKFNTIKSLIKEKGISNLKLSIENGSFENTNFEFIIDREEYYKKFNLNLN